MVVHECILFKPPLLPFEQHQQQQQTLCRNTTVAGGTVVMSILVACRVVARARLQCGCRKDDVDFTKLSWGRACTDTHPHHAQYGYNTSTQTHTVIIIHTRQQHVCQQEYTQQQGLRYKYKSNNCDALRHNRKKTVEMEESELLILTVNNGK